MLQTMGQNKGAAELACSSHVQHLLSKLPPDTVANFICYARSTRPGTPYTLTDFAAWLQCEAECRSLATQVRHLTAEIPAQHGKLVSKSAPATATILHGTNPPNQSPSEKRETQPKAYLYCNSPDHSIIRCKDLRDQSTENVKALIKQEMRCWRFAGPHMATNCNLKKPCPFCKRKHLGILHQANQRETDSKVLYLNPQSSSPKVLLKVVRVILCNKHQTVDTYAILDDGSQCTMLLPAATKQLKLMGSPESLIISTIRQKIETLEGASVSFEVSPFLNQQKSFPIEGAFTSTKLSLLDQTYPIDRLQKRYQHLRGLPLPSFSKVQPLLLIGADNSHLITPTKKVCSGPPGTSVAIHTQLGWTLQGRTFLHDHSATQTLYTTTGTPYAELNRQVEKLWQMDILPFRNEKLIKRSKQDKQAMEMLEAKTTRVNIDGTERYTTPLLHVPDSSKLQVAKESVMPLLRHTERHLAKNPDLAAVYSNEIEKLVQAGYVNKLTTEQISQSLESWYIPHHIVEHNSKHRIVFNCSFSSQGQALNDQLLPGPILGPSLLGVLLRFRQHQVAVNGDIKSMFHQIRLRPEDRPLLRFLWRDLKKEKPQDVYEWQVLSFGTTCSPCCAIYTVQRHAQAYQDHRHVAATVLQSFSVDNCLHSLPSLQEAKELIIELRNVFSSGGFDIRQWTSNTESVVDHLPSEAQADSTECWLSHDKADTTEGTLGLKWHFPSDTQGYNYRPVMYTALTMRNVYKVLATQYDPLGYIIPLTTRAKILRQQLWMKKREWDEPIPQGELQRAWSDWEDELSHLANIQYPRWYEFNIPCPVKSRELRIFCDASERAYGSVAFLRMEDETGSIHVSFVMARSRVAPRKQLTKPRLELCAALTGAQLAQLINSELTIPIDKTVLWSDSTVVLTWLQSESCRYKVFVATRITEILDLTSPQQWHYVDTGNNPANDITRGERLMELTSLCRWSRGPAFLALPSEQWPVLPPSTPDLVPDSKKTLFCGLTVLNKPSYLPDPSQFSTWQDLIVATHQSLQNTAKDTSNGSPLITHTEAETLVLSQAQLESFPDDYQALRSGKELPVNTRLYSLSPQFEQNLNLIRVGGRLRKAPDLELETLHPIVLDPKHPVTRLIIKDYDTRLLHPGPQRVFAEIRRSYWILRGRQAIKQHQRSCVECRKWRGKPVIPKMADLPPSRVRLTKLPFWSTGMDCLVHYSSR